MSNNYIGDDRRKAPLWVWVVIILCMLPVVAFPSMLSLTVAGSAARTFVWFYPFYVLASGICARVCWPDRKDVMWILLVLMLLSHAAMWMLIINFN